MCAARVVNPFSLNEMRRLSEAVRPASSMVPDPEARAKVCRNLYGRSSPEDTRAFVNRELALQRERASERWGFDFLKEIPRNSDRFVWSKVKPGAVPAAYALRRMAFLGGTLTVKISAPVAAAPTPAPAPQTAGTPSPADPAEVETASTTVSAAVSRWRDVPKADRTPSPVASTPALKRQAHITDYMKSRKRPSSSSKEGQTTKRARLESSLSSCHS